MEAFWQALTLNGGHNANVVMCGLAALGAASGPVGAFMILKRRPLLADAVAHAALPGVAAGFLISLFVTGDGRQTAFLLTGALIAGALSASAMHLLKDGRRIGEDAATAAALSVFFGLGVALLSVIQALPTGGQAGLNAFLLGQAATMTQTEAWIVAATGATATLAVFVFFKELTFAAFDASGARAAGLPVRALDLLTTALMLVLVAAGLRAVGLVLILALLVTPAAAARFWTDRLPRMALLAAAFGGGSAYMGGAASAALPDLPTGAVIVAILSGAFAFSLAFAPNRGAVSALWRRGQLRRSLKENATLAAFAGGGVGDPRLARRRGWANAAGELTASGSAAVAAWRRDQALRARYIEDHPNEAVRIVATTAPLSALLPRDVVAELERTTP